MNWQLLVGIGACLVFFFLLYVYNNRDQESPIYDEMPFVPVRKLAEKTVQQSISVKETGGTTPIRSKEENTENTENEIISHNIVPSTLRTKIIPPPHPIKSPRMAKGIQQEVMNNPVCLETEASLVKDGEEILADLSNNKPLSVPDVFVKYKSSRPTCDLLLQAWYRYFFGLQQLSNFILNKSLPPQPKLTTEKCQHEPIEPVQKRNAVALRKYVECRSKGGRDCTQPELEPVQFDSSCPVCERTFNKWAMYMYSLRAIEYYIGNK